MYLLSEMPYRVEYGGWDTNIQRLTKQSHLRFKKNQIKCPPSMFRIVARKRNCAPHWARSLWRASPRDHRWSAHRGAGGSGRRAAERENNWLPVGVNQTGCKYRKHGFWEHLRDRVCVLVDSCGVCMQIYLQDEHTMKKACHSKLKVEAPKSHEVWVWLDLGLLSTRSKKVRIATGGGKLWEPTPVRLKKHTQQRSQKESKQWMRPWTSE